MGKYGKWIGAGLGWAVGGPIGGVLGFAFGSIWDDDSLKKKSGSKNRADYKDTYQRYRHHTSSQDFGSAMIILSAAVMKADGKHMKSELTFIRSFFEKNFGHVQAAEQIGILKELLNKNIKEYNLNQVCEQIRYFMEHSMRLQLLHYLFGIAQADGHVASSEESMISNIARHMGISDKDYQSIKAMFYKDAQSAYKILEITKSATNSEVKQAYRRMANKYHPDKVISLGESHQKAAQEKFVKVQEAYEVIKKERGMK